ncbi:mandelate racemase/muconate lactonizing enzyme family protein [Microlunatus flavus]|uniref:L-alanine-DL-glutamate epimerase n=1 Tax=Microlunatus flavus TaxID=1036181 RepID=A0A1H9A8Z1_9ACTN|nr:mandelate racemase/muconate lactonizing enzyme family protein [Microlunatus flavus]SEP73130.1 L-alanine-DL-glutamate epimerase [Microlunatus flavus]
MIVDRIETFRRGPLLVVRVTTEDGDVGVGQAAPYEAGLTAAVLHGFVARGFLGREAWDAEALVDAFLLQSYKFPSSFVLRAVGGIETALWDLMARRAGQPVWRLLGGAARDRVPVYASSMLRSITPEAEAERIAALAAEQGFRAAKIRVGEAMGRDTDAAPGRTAAIIPLMRRELGDDFALSADANGGYTAAEAIRVGRRLEEHGYFHFEEPCPFPDLDATAAVAHALDIPVSGGEQDTVLPQFVRMVTTRAVDIVQPDIGYLGGVSRARKVAVLAEAAGIPCTPHCANASLLRVFTLHLALAMPACFQPQEWSIEDEPWARGVCSTMPQVVDGEVAAPLEPGWGIELEPAFLAAAEREESRRRVA